MAPALPPQRRRELARTMAEAVLRSAHPLAVAVVCDDADVAAWARDQSALVIWQPEQGLNRAVEAGVARLGELGAKRVVVAHADLPWATQLRAVGRFQGVTLVPDRREDGTNVACVPVEAGFRFAYGPGSFSRHAAEALRLGLPLRVLRTAALTTDVDLPTHLADLPSPGLGTNVGAT